MAEIRPLIAGNWKMNGVAASLAELDALREGVSEGGFGQGVDVMVCPPATLLAAAAARVKHTPVAIGAQDCHIKASGAFTGDLSAPMLADSGAVAVIVGHSERRSGHGERDQDVRAKAEAAHAAGLTAIICIGETAGERRLGLTLPVIGRQLAGSLPKAATAANTVIAYEPVWAIGTGLTPTLADVAEVHQFIRAELARLAGADIAGATRILYGGSVKPDNAAELLTIEGVDGALVGGASLKARDFLAIIAAGAAPSRSPA
ncbi:MULTISPECIES: triose-phosphate isomerase [Rhodomicrobium]|uniref:triose-phosphate isomerase n=1 Tax=Rhodomicrobium TaxID=1068 RepID=UPI000B4C1D43|nr:MULTISPECIES: triose-phosphate isomerase [Rhodomicrobium]